ncbi:MAG: tetratricopeptide repeat protein [Nitrospira sp.]|nr:tetratricopeptide repeat protein [Nitrospira sp.]MCP9475766.1 tetratricopeptide repeat protein [Nitrospira sp.]
MKHLLIILALVWIWGGTLSAVVNARGAGQGAGIEWRLLNEEAMKLYQAGKYDRAVILARKALQVAEQNVGPDHPEVAISLNNLAGLYRAQGQYATAEPLYTRSLAIREKPLGPDHPHVATSLENLAALYRTTHRDSEAQPLEQRAAKIRAMNR